MAAKKSRQKADAIGVTMLIGLMILIGVVGLAFALATKDTTLIKSLFFFWSVTGLFLILLASYLFRGEILIPRSKMMLPFGVYVCFSVLSTLFSGYKYAGAQELMSLVCCGMLFFIAARAVRDRKAFMLVGVMCLLVASISCAYGIAQHYGVDPAFRDQTPFPEHERSFSTMGHPNFFASFLILLLPVLLGVFHSNGRAMMKGLLIVLICAVNLCLFYTESRGAWLGFLGALPVWVLSSLSGTRWRLAFLAPIAGACAAMVVLLLSEGTRGYVVLWAMPFWLLAVLVLELTGERKFIFSAKPRWGVLLLAAVVVVSILFVNHDVIGGRMEDAFETEKGSVLARKVIWAGTLPMIRAKPIFGWGLGTFSIHFPRLRDPVTAGKIMPNTLHAHSEYLEIAAETGFVGLAAFLWMVGTFLWESIRRISRATDELKRLAAAGLAAGCVAILLQATVCVTTRWIVGRFFLWLGMALTIAVGAMSGSASEESGHRKNGGSAGKEAERFYRIKVKPIRAPGLRLATVLLIAGVMVVTGWLGERVWNSAVLTRKGEGYQIAAENVAAANLSEIETLKALSEAQVLREKAIELFERAVELNPYNLSAYYKLGHSYNLQGKLDDALRTYLRMSKLAPDGSDIHFNLGVVYANMRRWEDSRREYEAALSMKIEPLTRLGLARAYENLRLFDKAKKQYDALLKSKPDDVRAMNGLAALHLRRGDNESAMELSSKVVEIDPQNADARLTMGLIYQTVADYRRARGDAAHAAEYYEKSIAEQEVAVRVRPANVPMRAALALVCAEVGRFEEALAHLRTALQINPHDPLAHLNLGKVYRRMNEPERAAEAFQRTIELASGSPWAEEAKRELSKMARE